MQCLGMHGRGRALGRPCAAWTAVHGYTHTPSCCKTRRQRRTMQQCPRYYRFTMTHCLFTHSAAIVQRVPTMLTTIDISQEYWFQHRDQALWGRIVSVMRHPPRPQCTAWPLVCTFEQGLTGGWFDLRRHTLQPLMQVADARLLADGEVCAPTSLAALARHVPPAWVLSARTATGTPANDGTHTPWLRVRVCTDPPRLHVRGCLKPGLRAAVPLLATRLPCGGCTALRVQVAAHAAGAGDWRLCLVLLFSNGSTSEVCVLTGRDGSGGAQSVVPRLACAQSVLVGVHVVAAGSGDIDAYISHIFIDV